MTRPGVCLGDVGVVRFVHSPLSELCASLQLLHGGPVPPAHQPWLARRRRQLRRLDGAALRAVVPAAGRDVEHRLGSQDALAAPIGRHLDRMRSWSRAELTEVLDGVWRGDVPPSAADVVADGGAPRIADALSHFWQVMIEPEWGRMRAVVDQEIRWRQRALSDQDASVALCDLPVEVSLPAHSHGSPPADPALPVLVLLPSVFHPPLLTITVTRGEINLGYSPAGSGTAWSEERPEDDADRERALADLVGPGKASILAALDRPKSARELARELATRVPALAEDLATLRRCELVGTTRTRRGVVHYRSEIGTALVTSAGSAARPRERVAGGGPGGAP